MITAPVGPFNRPHPAAFGSQFGSQGHEREQQFTFSDDDEPRRATQSPVSRLRLHDKLLE